MEWIQDFPQTFQRHQLVTKVLSLSVLGALGTPLNVKPWGDHMGKKIGYGFNSGISACHVAQVLIALYGFLVN